MTRAAARRAGDAAGHDPGRRTEVKLCGMMSACDVAAAHAAGADHIGFVISPSRRRVNPEDVGLWLRTEAHPHPVLVGAGLSQTEWLAACEASGVDAIQVCGNADPQLCADLRGRGLQVWRAIAATDELCADSVRAYDDAVDVLLLDTHDPMLAGGTGRVFAWRLLERVSGVLSVPLFVAGGLDPDSVCDLLADYAPSGVDVSSGIETDGRKDPQKMNEFVKHVRGECHGAG